MKRLDDTHYILSQAEIDNMHAFIRDSLYTKWDRHTSTFLSDKTTDEGMRYMDENMYDFADALSQMMYSDEVVEISHYQITETRNKEIKEAQQKKEQKEAAAKALADEQAEKLLFDRLSAKYGAKK